VRKKEKVKLYKALIKHTKETQDYLTAALSKQSKAIGPVAFTTRRSIASHTH
jgi:hypothetical protein